MKIRTRQVSLDMLSFEHNGYRVYVATEGQSRIQVTISNAKSNELFHDQSFTPEQFISLLMRDMK